MANMRDSNIVLSKFKPQSSCYVHFRTNIRGKDIKPFILPDRD